MKTNKLVLFIHALYKRNKIDKTRQKELLKETESSLFTSLRAITKDDIVQFTIKHLGYNYLSEKEYSPVYQYAFIKSETSNNTLITDIYVSDYITDIEMIGFNYIKEYLSKVKPLTGQYESDAITSLRNNRYAQLDGMSLYILRVSE